MPSRRSSNQTLLEELLAVESWPIYLYELQIKDEGLGTSPGANQFTCTDKAYDANEWQTAVGINDSVFTDSEGTTFTLNAHSEGNVLSLSGTPADGEFTLSRWLYLASMPEDYTGSYGRITWNSKDYIPYPVEYGAIDDHELGQFPELQVNIPNPEIALIDLYKSFEKYNGLRSGILYMVMAFIDNTGTIYADVDATIIDKFIIVTSTISDQVVTLNVQSVGNLSEKKIPSRTYSKFTCDYVYKGIYCKYNGTITKCNKLETSYIMNNRKCTNTGGQTFQVPSDITLPGSNALVGCKVIIPEEQYIWEISANTASTFTTTSGSRLVNLSSFTTGGEIVCSIVDQESCFGHSDSGYLHTPYWILSDAWEGKPKSTIEKGNLLIDSKFERSGETWTFVENAGFNIEPTTNGLFITKTGALQNGYLAQLCDYTNPEMSPEYGHHYILYMQHYGYTITGSPSTAWVDLSLRVRFNGLNYYWNFDTRSWVWNVEQQKAITLHTTDYKLDFIKQYEENIRPNEYLAMVDFDWPLSGSTPYIASQVEVRLRSDLADNVRFKMKLYRLGLYRYIPYEHAGRFSGIPLTRVWFV